MPNDAISREAAIEAVRDLFDTHGKWTSWAMIHQAIAALPADRRWAELRAASVAALKHVEELRDAWVRGVIDDRDGRGGTRSSRNVDVEVALRKALDRLAPPADGAEE